MTLDSLPDLDTSGLCLVKTLSKALSRVGRIGTSRSGTAPEHPRALRRSPKGERPRYTAGPRRRGKPKHSHRGHPVPCPWKRRSQAVRQRKTSVLRACRVPNPAKRLDVVQRPKTLFVERLPRHGQRSEERRVGKECRSRWAQYH